MGKSGYKPFSAFWGLGVPAVLMGVIWYAYNSQGWVSYKVQKLVGPVVEPALRFIGRVL